MMCARCIYIIIFCSLSLKKNMITMTGLNCFIITLILRIVFLKNGSKEPCRLGNFSKSIIITKFQ